MVGQWSNGMAAYTSVTILTLGGTSTLASSYLARLERARDLAAAG